METYSRIDGPSMAMSREPPDTGLGRINDRSKAVSVVGTFVAFGVGIVAVGEVQFVSVAAIAVGIGIRFGSLWIGIRYLMNADGSTLTDHPTAGGFHHGAVGFALVAAGVVAMVGRSLGGETTLVGGVAVGTAVIGFLGLSVLLPE